MSTASEDPGNQSKDKARPGLLKSLLLGRGLSANSLANVTGRLEGAPRPGERIVEAWSAVRKLYAPKKTHRQETFEEAVERLQLSKERLAEQAVSIRNASRGAYACAVLMLLILIYSSMTSAGTLRVLAVGVLFFFCMVQGWIRAFRVWQIRQRRLGGIDDFFRQAENWIV